MKTALFLTVLSALISFSIEAKTFVYCSEGSPSAFNPQVTTDGTSNNASAHTIYETLVDFKYGSTKLTPALAKSWTISKDRKSYTFNLRKGVKFHKTKFFTPTREFNSDDVVFSLNRMRDKKHAYHKVNGGHYEYWNGMDMGNLVKSVEKIGQYKVKITLTRPEAPFLANTAMSFMSILSKEYADHLTKIGKQGNIDNFPVGTGSFIYKSYKKDTVVRFIRNNKYWGRKAKVDKLVFSITPDASVRYQKLKTGECHLIIEPAPADITAMKKNPKIKVISGAGLNVGYLAMNTQKKPYNNVLVRKAINHALNKKSYIDAIYLGNAQVAKNPLPPTIWSYNKKIRDYDYNIAKAKKLLAKAGYPNGFETELWTLPVTRPYNPNGKKMGEIMQADLAKIGVKVKLVSYDWPTYLKKSRDGEHQLIQLGWTGDNGDPDNFLHVLLGCSGVKGGSNVARWCDKGFNDLIMKAKLSTNIGKRTTLYKKAQRIFKEKAPWATIAHSTIFRAMAKNVKGYKIDPLGGDIFKEVDLK
ncbi:MAG: ABC transporter substrate-binding protein [Halobacteriovoraceae bacterium]|jgi:dipeptide transport system substrate-binding protein|nr:ABC transporter substrate-binding protein [Halobacteriovoraceae bacterium]MBT5094306.1 ABC transporter substrate-binding protein [Halobacteriovoraceae bacterium]